MRTRKQLENALEQANMSIVRYMAQMVARHEQVKALRKIARKLYDAAVDAHNGLAGWKQKLDDVVIYYEKEME